MRTGRQATDAQVKTLRLNLNHGASLLRAAMKAGMDRKTARKYRDRGQLPSEAQVPHTWRTRPDPLAEVWPAMEVVLQRSPTFQAKTLVEWLQREYPEQDWQRQRRTVERRVRQWKAEHGPAKEVFLPQRRLETLERQQVQVSKGGTIQVMRNIYSVPSRLRGEWLEARIGAEVIEVWYAGSCVQTMERLRGVSKHRINYRHVIDWLGRSHGTCTARTCTRV